MKTGHWLPLYETLRLLATLLFGMLFGFRTYFRGRMPAEGGVLIVANHQSYLDPILLGLAARRPVSFMARSSLFERSSLFARLIGSLGAFPLRRGVADTKALRRAVSLLKAGHVVLIFPEGSRTPDGTIGELQGGFGVLSRRGKATVLPCLIDGANDVWPRKAGFLKRRRCQTAFCEPIGPQEAREKGARWVAVEVARRLRTMQRKIRRMHRKPPPAESRERWTYLPETDEFVWPDGSRRSAR